MILKILEIAKSQMALILAIALTATLASGCAGQKLGKQTVVVKHYPQCYRPVSDLRKRAEAINKATATSAVVGALTGAAIGYMQGGGKKSDIVKGALSGGLAGAGLGYLISSEVQAMDHAQRFQTYYKAMDMDIGNMKQAVAAAKITAGCYKKEYQNLSRNYKSGRLSDAEMYERLQEIKDGTNDAYKILQNYSEGSSQMASTFDQVIEMESDRPDRASASLIRSVHRKKASYEAEVKSASKMESTLTALMTDFSQELVAGREINRSF
ncbi:MAG: hypothetical protein LBT86_03730 [Deltaproteobacteria bacterium]|jgi:hypothetical protein|nr:hypothetical protein [Deltaproteobacteria bacterium]